MGPIAPLVDARTRTHLDSGRYFQVRVVSRRLVVGVRHEHGVQNVDAPASQAEDGLALAFALVSLAVVVDPRGGCFRLEKAARKCPLEAMVAEPCGSVAANRSAGLVRSGPQPGVRRQGPNESQGVPRGHAYELSPADRSILRQLSFTLIRRNRVRHAFPTCHRRCRGCRFRRRLAGYSSQRRRCFRVHAATAAATAPLTSYSSDGTPQFGYVGQGQWQVAGLVNMGEPTIRIVYDQTVPGAYAAAMSDVYQLESVYPTLQQPGVTTGLREVGYSAQYNGVQVQVWGNNPSIDTGVTSSLAQAGLPLIHA